MLSEKKKKGCLTVSSAGTLNFPWKVLPWQFISFIAPVLAQTQTQQYNVCMDNEDSIYNS